MSPFSKYHAATYTARFGSWQTALEKFIEYVNSDNEQEKDIDNSNSQLVVVTGSKDKGLKEVPHPTSSIIFKMLSTYSLSLAKRGTLCWLPSRPLSFIQLKNVPCGARCTKGRRRAMSLNRLAS